MNRILRGTKTIVSDTLGALSLPSNHTVDTLQLIQIRGGGGSTFVQPIEELAPFKILSLWVFMWYTRCKWQLHRVLDNIGASGMFLQLEASTFSQHVVEVNLHRLNPEPEFDFDFQAFQNYSSLASFSVMYVPSSTVWSFSFDASLV